MNKTTDIPEWKLINNIVGLLIQADTNLSITERFYQLVEPPLYKQSLEYEFLRFTANNGFNESVSILHTILNGYTKSGKEEFVLPDDGNADLKAIKDNPFLKIIRNHSADHKSIKLEQPSGALYNKLKKEHIESTRRIIEQIKSYLLKKYNYSCESVTKNTILNGLNLIIKPLNFTTNS